MKSGAVENVTPPRKVKLPFTAAALRNVAVWLDNGCDPKKAAAELRLLAKSLEDRQ
jgi:hypothetical protein